MGIVLIYNNTTKIIFANYSGFYFPIRRKCEKPSALIQSVRLQQDTQQGGEMGEYREGHAVDPLPLINFLK